MNMAEKRYYYLKLKEDFFETDELKILESMENGYLYSNILLKLYLKGLKNDGKLTFNEYIPYDAKMLATLTGHNVDVVEKAIRIFQSMHLIEILDNGTIFMLDMQTLIGSITDEGLRKQRYRARIEQEKNKDGTKLGQNTNIISNSISNSNSISIEDNDEEEKKQKEKEKQEKRMAVYKEIIDYLNEKTKRRYSYKRKTTQEHIRARIKEGYIIADFKKVIDTKCSKWLGDPKMEDYLRPDTLFGNKFEGYLNECTEKEIYVRKEQEKVYDKEQRKKDSQAFLEKLRENDRW